MTVRVAAASMALAIALAAAGLFALPRCSVAQPAGSGGYFVDYDHGDDSRNGRSPGAAWRHAPGDPNASGVAARTILKPGDQLLFAAGVRYRGAIVLNGEGTEAAPIVLTSAKGGAPAIIDGSERASTVRSCRDAADCGGAPGWRNLVRVEFAQPAGENAVLFTQDGPLFPAQSPNTPSQFYGDEVAHFLPVQGQDLEAGRAPLPKDLVAQLATPGERRLALWVAGNLVKERPITAMEGDVARFDPTGLKFYTDRPDRLAVVGHPALIDQPGEYAFIDNRRAAVAQIPASSQVSVAEGRAGVSLNGKSHVVITGLTFENMNGVTGNVRAGGAVTNWALDGGRDVRIERNRFRNLWMPNGQGAVTVRGIQGLKVTDNVIENVGRGSGIRVQRAAQVLISGNRVRRVGRTGIMVMDVNGGQVLRNVVWDVKGVHGNAMSAYLDNRDIRIAENVVYDASRPMTFHGGKVPQNGLIFSCNVFVASGNTDGAITSWSSKTPVVGLRIENNVLIGGKGGAKLSGIDQDVTITGNVSNGISVRGPSPVGWSMTGNREIEGQAAQAAAARNAGDPAATVRQLSAMLDPACRTAGHKGD